MSEEDEKQSLSRKDRSKQAVSELGVVATATTAFGTIAFGTIEYIQALIGRDMFYHGVRGIAFDALSLAAFIYCLDLSEVRDRIRQENSEKSQSMDIS